MAILRGREVKIESVMADQDASTFLVRYPDGETEIAKLHELGITHDEYNQHIAKQMPVIHFIDGGKEVATEAPKSEKKKK